MRARLLAVLAGAHLSLTLTFSSLIARKSARSCSCGSRLGARNRTRVAQAALLQTMVALSPRMLPTRQCGRSDSGSSACNPAVQTSWSAAWRNRRCSGENPRWRSFSRSSILCLDNGQYRFRQRERGKPVGRFSTLATAGSHGPKGLLGVFEYRARRIASEAR